MARSRLLTLIEVVLRERGKPHSAKALVAEIQSEHPNLLRGRTPWKTVGARLAVDIRRNSATPFLRLGRGLYGLREWPGVAETHVPARQLNPLDEDILVVPKEEFLGLLGPSPARGLHDVDYVPLLSRSKTVARRDAEATEEYVQLIPSFVVLRGTEILSYKRTKKTPENRLHDTRSIVFGGHLQAEDIPELFADERAVVDAFLFRELLEELALNPSFERYLYAGMLYLTGTAFERQHAGIVFFLEVGEKTEATSLEPGYHSGLEFISCDKLVTSSVMEDRWSRVCITALGLNP